MMLCLNNTHKVIDIHCLAFNANRWNLMFVCSSLSNMVCWSLIVVGAGGEWGSSRSGIGCRLSTLVGWVRRMFTFECVADVFFLNFARILRFLLCCLPACWICLEIAHYLLAFNYEVFINSPHVPNGWRRLGEHSSRSEIFPPFAALGVMENKVASPKIKLRRRFLGNVKVALATTAYFNDRSASATNLSYVAFWWQSMENL